MWFESHVLTMIHIITKKVIFHTVSKTDNSVPEGWLKELLSLVGKLKEAILGWEVSDQSWGTSWYQLFLWLHSDKLDLNVVIQNID